MFVHVNYMVIKQMQPAQQCLTLFSFANNVSMHLQKSTVIAYSAHLISANMLSHCPKNNSNDDGKYNMIQ